MERCTKEINKTTRLLMEIIGGLLIVFNAYANSVTETERGRIRMAFADPNAFEKALAEGLASKDPLVRRFALCSLYEKDPARAKAEGRKLVDDPAREVRDFLVDLKVLEKKGGGDFRFNRENVAPSMNPQDDHDYLQIAQFNLPVKDWRIFFDATNVGHKAKPLPFFAPAFDDAKWLKVSVGTWWETQGCPDYDGIAWYRVRFTLPEKPAEGVSFELKFGGVDEEAWVWLNGTYVGQHVEGVHGWDKPFGFDVREELKWDAENVLVVRVSDTELGGGIWKPVVVEVLK